MDLLASILVGVAFGLLIPHAVGGSASGAVLAAEALIGMGLVRALWVKVR